MCQQTDSLQTVPCLRSAQGTSQFSSRLGSRHVALQEDLTPGEHHQRLLAAARLSAEQKAVLCALRVPLYTNFGRLQVSTHCILHFLSI